MWGNVRPKRAPLVGRAFRPYGLTSRVTHNIEIRRRIVLRCDDKIDYAVVFFFQSAGFNIYHVFMKTFTMYSDLQFSLFKFQWIELPQCPRRLRREPLTKARLDQRFTAGLSFGTRERGADDRAPTSISSVNG